MQIRKPTESFDNLILAISGHIENDRVIESNVDTLMHVKFEDVMGLYDQLLALGDTPVQSVDLTILHQTYTFPRRMAIELLRICEQIYFDFEIGDSAEHLPEEQWTEEYLLSL